MGRRASGGARQGHRDRAGAVDNAKTPGTGAVDKAKTAAENLAIDLAEQALRRRAEEEARKERHAIEVSEEAEA